MRATVFIFMLALLLAAAGYSWGAPPQLRMLASEPEPYLGQAFLLSIEVRRGNHSGALKVDWPSMDNLAVEAHLPATVRRLEGEGQNQVVEYLQRLVRPLRSGPLVLAPQTGTARATQPPALQVNVRPLPVKGRPDSFNGLVGRLDYRLEDPAGRGRRQIVLHLNGDADLSRAIAPLAVSDGGTLTLLDEQRQRHGKFFTRQLRYLYTPADNGHGKLQVNLSWFDPQSGSYRQSAPIESRPNPELFLVLIPALVLGLAVLRRLSIRKKHLHRWLNEESFPGTRRQRLARLALAGGSEGLQKELHHFWQERDRRFASTQESGICRPSKKMRRRLLKHIDKIDKPGLFRQ